ncbi:MAG: hypothetical protein ACP5NU_04515 [Methanomicrobiales archaeon]|nr:hypothetical protein [Burkholderiaceae bacterium]HNJ80180.1 hypothetical protein [Methanoregulaceae archaeon]HNO08626.1 hypothetical protein [Methanoregulaceae archaeon]HPS22423.1 hypothetical protein [Methanoregulaceae archaeon]HQP82132.1 hypothetical protein [Methanoregulaceae archaeon]
MGLFIIALVIASVSLFLSLFNAIILIDISKKISVLKKIGISHTQNEVSTSYVQKDTALREQGNTFTENALQENNGTFVSGMQSVIGRYTIDSMVVAMTDGLVVASVGNKNPEYDAAYYSSVFEGRSAQPEQGILLIPLKHRGVPLVGIARTSDVIPEETMFIIAKEMQSVFEQNC